MDSFRITCFIFVVDLLHGWIAVQSNIATWLQKKMTAHCTSFFALIMTDMCRFSRRCCFRWKSLLKFLADARRFSVYIYGPKVRYRPRSAVNKREQISEWIKMADKRLNCPGWLIGILDLPVPLEVHTILKLIPINTGDSNICQGFVGLSAT